MIRVSTFWLVALLFFTGCQVTYLSQAEIDYERVSDEVKEGDKEIESMIAPYQENMRLSMDEEISILEVDLVKERPESNMGNWLVDIFYEEANKITDDELDFAVLNQGGMRLSSLSKGPVLAGEIYELIPFDNIVSILEASGEEVLTFLDHIAEGKGWPVSHHVQLSIKDKKAFESTIDGKSIDPKRIYRFAVPDYIAGGGSGSWMLKQLKRTDHKVLIREMTITYLKEQHKKEVPQHPKKDGRIQNLDHE